jgi:hypothetical protein
MFVSSAVLVLNTLISANVDGHFELFLQSKEEITLVGGLAQESPGKEVRWTIAVIG